MLSHISYHLFFFCAEILELLMEKISIHKTSIQLLTLENTFSSLPACHSARRACPELQNPLLQRAKENLLCGKEEPVSGRMRGGEKGLSPNPHPSSATVPTVPEDDSYSWDDGFCDSTFGSTQNDSIGGDIGALKKIKGRFCPVLTEQILLSRRYLTVHHL